MNLGLSLAVTAVRSLVAAVVNLVVNGDGSGGSTSPWAMTGGNGTIALVGGKLRVTCDGAASFVQFSQAIPTVVSQTYNTLADVAVVSGAPAFWGVRKADDAAASVNAVALSSGDGVNQAATFSGTSTTTYVILQVNTANSVVDFDNIKVPA